MRECDSSVYSRAIKAFSGSRISARVSTEVLEKSASCISQELEEIVTDGRWNTRRLSTLGAAKCVYDSVSDEFIYFTKRPSIQQAVANLRSEGVARKVASQAVNIAFENTFFMCQLGVDSLEELAALKSPSVVDYSHRSLN